MFDLEQDNLSEFVNLFSKKNDDVFFSREREIELLENSFVRKTPMGRHWGIHGPRRVGKTALVEFFIRNKREFFKQNNSPFFYLRLTGAKKVSKKQQILNATEALNRIIEQIYGEKKIEVKAANDWWTFFGRLILTLDKVSMDFPQIPIFLFFDELDWFADNEDFINGYSDLINQTQFSMANTMTFIASSDNSWINSRIFNDVNGLHRRLLILRLKPFSFNEICRFFKQEKYSQSIEHVAEYYMLFGGYIKHYKDFPVDFSVPLSKNFKEIAMNKEYFNKEVEDVFRNLLDDKRKYFKTYQEVCLAKHISGDDFSSKGGRKTSVKANLKKLSDAGLLGYTTSNKKRVYFCAMQILFFYFTFYKEDELSITNEKMNHWRGAAFELLALNHFRHIEKVLQLETKEVKGNFTFTHENEGGQVDLITRVKNTSRTQWHYCVFEMKCMPHQNIEKKEVERFVERIKKAQEYLKEASKKEIKITPFFLTLNEDRKKNCYSLPLIMTAEID